MFFYQLTLGVCCTFNRQANDPLGCHLLSICYEKGLGGAQMNDKAALELCMKAKSLGRIECDECIKRVCVFVFLHVSWLFNFILPVICVR